jgi:hypothetical protein
MFNGVGRRDISCKNIRACECRLCINSLRALYADSYRISVITFAIAEFLTKNKLETLQITSLYSEYNFVFIKAEIN